MGSFRVYTRETKIQPYNEKKYTWFQLSKHKYLHNKSIVEISKHLKTCKGINKSGKCLDENIIDYYKNEQRKYLFMW